MPPDTENATVFFSIELSLLLVNVLTGLVAWDECEPPLLGVRSMGQHEWYTRNPHLQCRGC